MAQAIHEERCMGRRCMHRVVDDEFHHWQKFAPIRKRMNTTPKDFLNNAVCTFCLTICFRMVRGRHLKARTECFEHGSPEFLSGSWVSIRDEFTRQSMQTKDRVNKNTSTCRRIDRFRYSDHVYHSAESINEHKNSCILVWVCEESKDKVY